MGPEEVSNPLPSQPGTAETSGVAAPQRRPGRGRGGRGRRRKQKRPVEQLPSAPIGELTGPAAEREESAPERDFPPEPAASRGKTESAELSEPARPEPAAVSQSKPPAPPATVQMAIEEVNQIINTLQETLDDMDEVREMLEIFERQSNVDQREIESLRRALRHLQRPREGGQAHRGQ